MGMDPQFHSRMGILTSLLALGLSYGPSSAPEREWHAHGDITKPVNPWVKSKRQMRRERREAKLAKRGK